MKIMNNYKNLENREIYEKSLKIIEILIFFYLFCRALRVLPAETRLTVYRRPSSNDAYWEETTVFKDNSTNLSPRAMKMINFSGDLCSSMPVGKSHTDLKCKPGPLYFEGLSQSL